MPDKFQFFQFPVDAINTIAKGCYPIIATNVLCYIGYPLAPE